MAQDALDALEESLRIASVGIATSTISIVKDLTESPTPAPNLLDMGIDEDIIF